MALYGSIPYMIAHKYDFSLLLSLSFLIQSLKSEKFSIGVLWLNAAETWVDTSTNFSDKGIFSNIAKFITKSKASKLQKNVKNG